MPGYLTLIFVCQLLGELAVGALALPIPGPVLGMVLLFVWLLRRGAVPEGLGDVAGGLQRAMSLLFVPAGAGVMLHFQLLGDALLPLGIGLVVSTLLTILVTGAMMHWLAKGDAQ
ncbi:CidA/LrgA family protein [Aliiruegeria sabulilitoris]|uniref:CidA/LrgA family protein n=1 Tax=Aliiruegeria sabulilitoris TaxID=1510458 RepID=UPI0008366ACF|nr:CidA/LrgA family protein [Aliiruegeria sabulilitoris]NDR56515.1 CidA/LrgA family protein [Pseudoruegeria sp. M32A2M]